jgi:hypothetical protein
LFDTISLYTKHFYYGRYDIKCASVAALKQGKDFSILEYNGCGAEPNHFYDTGYTLRAAYKEVLMHWKYLYNICMYNRSQGVKPWPFMKGFTFRKYTRDLFAEMKLVDDLIG